MNMKNWIHCLFAGLACVSLAGCAHEMRSISHSGHQEESGAIFNRCPDGNSDAAFQYRGELSEYDVLGLSRTEPTSEADITRALENAEPLRLRPGNSILLIQSGSLLPDAAMVSELSRQYRVLPFSGVPTLHRSDTGSRQTESFDPEGYSKSLRMAAARAGADFVLCYWGRLESATDRLPTKNVSWLPVVHWLVPDEKLHTRIQLKIALVDVRSGKWSLLSPKSFETAGITTSPHRATTEQKQVEQLKRLAYKASADEVAKSFD
jgi:hypothetical protein